MTDSVAIWAPDSGEQAGGMLDKDPARLPLSDKRVLIIVENLPVPFDRRVWQESLALRDAGATVSIISPRGKGFERSYECHEGIHIHRHPLTADASTVLGYLFEYGTALLWQTILAWRIFFGRGFDVIHICNPPDLGFLIAMQFRLFGRRYIFDHHDINPELFEVKFGRRGWLWRAVVTLEKINFLCARVVISTNESYRSIAQTRGKKRKDDVFVVRSGPDVRRLKHVPPDPSLKRGRRYMVCYVGVMGEQEGLDLLLQAVCHLVNECGRTDIGFCLVGSGSSRSAMEQLSHDMGIAEYVHFTGRISDEELARVLCSADVGVNPDRVNPMNDLSTMNKVLEYMAFGKAQVQFAVKEGRVSAGETSLYAEPNNPVSLAAKILELLDNPAQREAMGRAAQQRFHESLSWDHQKPVLIAAYQRAMSRA
ncbi:glycosyltransferase family 4 protein [Novosphingobium sp.]|uniref:glycosyltransferase family 4 protein n=1 Tax=Novosphingobium sp. TaxID=1874826 RepID=UPI002608F594|nr:glycosyltransferase family 4 protein [Novosphingobium sp.]